MTKQNDGALNWADFERRFKAFLPMVANRKVQANKRGPCGMVYIKVEYPFWLGTPQACCFSNDGYSKDLGFTSVAYGTYHPNVIITTLIGSGISTEPISSPPTFAVFSVCSGFKEKEAEADMYSIFCEVQTLLSVTYIFKPLLSGLEIYREIEVNGITRDPKYDSLCIPTDITGDIVRRFARLFDQHVVHEHQPIRNKVECSVQ